MIQRIIRKNSSNIKLLKSGSSLLSLLLPANKWHQPMNYCVRSIGKSSTINVLVKNITEPLKRPELISYIMEVLSCEKSIATQIIHEVPELNEVHLVDFKKIVDILFSENMNVATLAENPFILSMPIGLHNVYLCGERFKIQKFSKYFFSMYALQIYFRSDPNKAFNSAQYEPQGHK